MDTVNCIKNKVIKCKSKQSIKSVSISSADSMFAVGQINGNKNEPTLSLFDFKSGECVEVIEKSENSSNSVYDVLFSKNKDILYYIIQTGTEYLYIAYDCTTKEKKVLYKSSAKNFVLELSSDKNDTILIPDLNTKLITYNNVGIKEVHIDLKNVLKNTTDINKASIVLSPSGKEIAVTNAEKGKVLIYDLSQKKITFELKGNFYNLNSLYYDAAGKYILAIKENNQLIAWNNQTHILHLESKCEYINGVLSLNFNQKANFFAIGMITPFVIIFDVDTGKRLYKDDLQDGRVYDVCFSHDGEKLISAGEDGKIVIRELEIR